MSRIQLTWGGGTADALLDRSHGIVVVYDGDESFHARYGGQCYYRSRSGLSGAGWAESLYLQRLGTYRRCSSSAPRDIAWGPDFDGQRILVPVTRDAYGHHEVDSSAPIVIVGSADYVPQILFCSTIDISHLGTIAPNWRDLSIPYLDARLEPAELRWQFARLPDTSCGVDAAGFLPPAVMRPLAEWQQHLAESGPCLPFATLPIRPLNDGRFVVQGRYGEAVSVHESDEPPHIWGGELPGWESVELATDLRVYARGHAAEVELVAATADEAVVTATVSGLAPVSAWAAALRAAATAAGVELLSTPTSE